MDFTHGSAASLHTDASTGDAEQSDADLRARSAFGMMSGQRRVQGAGDTRKTEGHYNYSYMQMYENLKLEGTCILLCQVMLVGHQETASFR